MNALSIFASAALLALISGCASSTTESSSDATENLSIVPQVTNASFHALVNYWDDNAFEHAANPGSAEYSFRKNAAMSDADALAVAKSIASTSGLGEIKQYTLSATQTPSELAQLAAELEEQIHGDGDPNTPELTTYMVKAFALPGQAPGGAIKVFVATGSDSQNREVIFLDTRDGDAVSLDG